MASDISSVSHRLQGLHDIFNRPNHNSVFSNGSHGLFVGYIFIGTYRTLFAYIW